MPPHAWLAGWLAAMRHPPAPRLHGHTCLLLRWRLGRNATRPVLQQTIHEQPATRHPPSPPPAPTHTPPSLLPAAHSRRPWHSAEPHLQGMPRSPAEAALMVRP